MEHPSNFFSRTHLGKSPESGLKSEGAVCNCRLLAKSYFQVKGNFCLPGGAEFHIYVYVVVLF